MITTLIATLALAPIQGGLACAVMGSPVKSEMKISIDYAGVRYPMCCGGCDGAFKKNPTKFATSKDKAVGYALYDVVAGTQLDFKDSKPVGPVLENGVQFYFSTQANLDTFKANPEVFSKLPEKEALYCAVMDHKIEAGKGGAYVDYEGTRYYVCCAGCQGKFKADMPKYAKIAAKAVTKTAAYATPKS